MQHITVDNSICTGCQSCQLVCSFHRTGEFNMKRSAIRVPFEGKFPGKVQVCRQCSNARCVKVCPEKALERDRQSIRLDRSRCSGCGMCVEACPFNAIYLDPVDGLAVKCDLCNGKFMCVEYCQKQAIKVIK